jgi:hypothetical protein
MSGGLPSHLLRLGSSEPIIAPADLYGEDMTRSRLTLPFLTLALCTSLLWGCGDSTSGASSGASSADVTEAEPDTAPEVDSASSADTVVVEDVAPAAPACNPYSQDGCLEGEKCAFNTQDEIACMPAGAKPIGEVCEGVGDCAQGLCLGLSGTDSRCYEFCKIDAHCQPGADCLELQGSPYKVCEIDGIYDFCTLLTDSCEPGKSCYWGNADAPVCLPEGSGLTKDSCQGPSDCASTHTCINKNCLPLCKKNETEPCGDAFTPCVDYYPPQQVGYCDV